MIATLRAPLLVALGGILGPLPALARPAPEGPEAVVRPSLDGLASGVESVPGSELLGGLHLRVAVVVYEDGRWTTAIGPWVEAVPSGAEQAAEAVRGFIDRSLQAALPPVLPRPASAPRTIARTIAVAGGDERLRRGVEQIVDGVRSGSGPCIGRSLVTGHPVTVRVRVTVEPDGALAVSRVDHDPSPVSARLYGCVEPGIRQSRVGAPGAAKERTFERDVTVERRRATGPAPRGHAGEVCDYGSHAGFEDPWTELPTPAPCKPGLQCCHGGAPGSGGVCMKVRFCPALP